MKIQKTHVRSPNRQAKLKEIAVAGAAKRSSTKSALGRKQKIVVQTGFRVRISRNKIVSHYLLTIFQFKSQAERYGDISVDLKTLLDDAVERYGRYDAAQGAAEHPAPDISEAELEDERVIVR